MTTSTPDDAATDATAATAAGPDPRTAVALRDLAMSIALLPQAPQPEGGEQPEGAIALPVIEQEGRRYIPVFTSEDALRPPEPTRPRRFASRSHSSRRTGRRTTCGSR
jgi:hypothetical protein